MKKLLIATLSISMIFSSVYGSSSKSVYSDQEIKQKTLAQKQQIKGQNTKKAVNGKVSEGKIEIVLSDITFDLNKKFKKADVEKLGTKELSILRNAIFAKHGYIFSDKALKSHFKKYQWYKPKVTSVGAKLNTIDKENISLVQKAEGQTPSKLRVSKNDKAICDDTSFVYEGKKKTLKVDISDLKNSDGNKPVKIVLAVDNQKIKIENEWNDGFKIAVTDFDKNDNLIDIYITFYGTDVGCNTNFYSYDGKRLIDMGSIGHIMSTFLYDNSGWIYYIDPEDYHDENIFDHKMHYITQNAVDIKDQKLIKQLNAAAQDE